MPDISQLPQNWQLHIVTAYVGFKAVSELYSSVRAGGGLRKIILSFWFGEQTPTVSTQPPFPSK